MLFREHYKTHTKNFIVKKILQEHPLKPGKKHIAIQFKIDKKGSITDVVARAPNPALEKEAIRVVNSLPQMKPGTLKGKPVGVLYSIPILFKVENNTTEDVKQVKNH